ncbi:hypothetical protein ONZ45_g12378 [Pleurotus djamor]|nr:hypothetical protein ONZ45_g12378 [Pleurotus djamor]
MPSDSVHSSQDVVTASSTSQDDNLTGSSVEPVPHRDGTRPHPLGGTIAQTAPHQETECPRDSSAGKEVFASLPWYFFTNKRPSTKEQYAEVTELPIELLQSALPLDGIDLFESSFSPSILKDPRTDGWILLLEEDEDGGPSSDDDAEDG